MAIAKEMKFDIYALSFRYGQRNSPELEMAKNTALKFGAKEHKIIDINLASFGGSALTDNIDVPKNKGDQIDGSVIPVTYVPARNLVFLSLATAYAEVLGAWDIFIGVNALDYSGYPDCRPEFIAAFQKTANLATKAGLSQKNQIKIHTPLIHLKKSEIIKKGDALGVDYSKTLTCYDPTPEGLACGQCDSCVLRRNGFREAGIPDPTKYVR
ncbi:MAG: 7-cyano-7-deazaguanine synthase QueC [Candidatus Marinimicrobia bacterium]|nr:7-cyano-7-deazaguanine synthase QueC [Candidatus Neomarinimicrobiota bacterium]